MGFELMNSVGNSSLSEGLIKTFLNATLLRIRIFFFRILDRGYRSLVSHSHETSHLLNSLGLKMPGRREITLFFFF